MIDSGTVLNICSGFALQMKKKKKKTTDANLENNCGNTMVESKCGQDEDTLLIM